MLEPVTNPKTETQQENIQKKKPKVLAPSQVVIAGILKNQQYFKVKAVSNMVTLFLSFFLELWLLFFRRLRLRIATKTNRSLPNLHVPHKGQWPEVFEFVAIFETSLYPQLRTFL